MKIKHIKQTNTAILFSKITGNVESMNTVLNCTVDDRKFEDICSKYKVSSFNEFLQKFEPVVYMTATTNGRTSFSIDKRDETSSAIYLNKNNALVDMISKIIETKSDRDVDFNWQECIDLLSAKTMAKKIKKKQEDIQYLAKQCIEAETQLQRKESEKKLNKEISSTRQYYSNPMNLLPYLIEQSKEYVDEANKILLADKSGQHSEEVKTAILTYNENGIEYKAVEKNNDNSDLEDKSKSSTNAQAELIEDKLNQCYDVEEKKNYLLSVNGMRSMVLQTFSSPVKPQEYTIELRDKFEKQYNEFNNIYAEYSMEFSKQAKQLIEIVMGVKVFFEQHRNIEDGMKPSLFIANCNSDEIDSERWEAFFEHTNNTTGNVNNAIWFSIVPNVSLDSSEDDEEDDIFGDSYDDFDTSMNETVSKTNLKLLLSIMKKYEIQTFFSFETNGECSFSSIASEGISKYIDITKSLEGMDYSDIAIPCYPNFTIISERKTNIDNTPDIQIGACFTACGLVCAYQNPSYLSARKLNVAKEIPGVRFDVESNSPSVPTTLSVEISGYSNKIKDEIRKEMHGFQFCSEGSKNVTVMTARSLEKESETNMFEPIYKRTVATYIKRLLDYQFQENNGYDADDIESVINEDAKMIIWSKSEKCVNGLFQQGDDIHLENKDSDEPELLLKLKGVAKKVTVKVKK